MGGFSALFLSGYLTFVFWNAHLTVQQQLEEWQNSVLSVSVGARKRRGEVKGIHTDNKVKIDWRVEQAEQPNASEWKFHIVFSTGCNAFQDWQSFVFFYQIMKSGQEGQVTRVASGCTEEGADALERVFAEQIQTLPFGKNRFHLHLTPDYSGTAGFDYKFFNKPFGLLHWMEHGMGWSGNATSKNTIPKDTIVVVLDPDQFLLRPFVADFTNDPAAVWHEADAETKEFVVKEGRPFSQFYGLGAHWLPEFTKGMPDIVEAAINATSPEHSSLDPNDRDSSHLYQWTRGEIVKSYAAGPPYIAVASDMYKIVKTWAAVVVPVYQYTHGHLSEMYAYSAGAAHVGLPHQLADSFMVSSTAMDKEGWKPIDEAAPEDVCRHARSDVSKDPEAAAWAARLPQVLHYCQRYFLGPYFFNKYKLPKDFLSCGKPLLKDPLDHEGAKFATLYDSSVTPNNEFNQIPARHINRHAFMLCYIISIMNEATSYWKQHHCTDEDDPNYSKEFLFPKDKKKGFVRAVNQGPSNGAANVAAIADGIVHVLLKSRQAIHAETTE